MSRPVACGLRRARGAMVAAALACGACTLGPDYVRPDVSVPDTYRFASETDAATAAATPTDSAYWWAQIGDSVLDGLIATARANNRDVLIAAARVEEYYGRVMVARSGLFPQVGAELGGTRQRVSASGGSLVPLENPFNQVRIDAFASW